VEYLPVVRRVLGLSLGGNKNEEDGANERRYRGK
jgi:hypothetical protein